MDKKQSFEKITINQKYLTNIKDYKYNLDNKIVYLGKYITPQDLDSVKKYISKDLLYTLEGFSIEAYKNKDGDGIEIPPLHIKKLQQDIKDTIDIENDNAVTVYHITPKKDIIDYLEVLSTGKKENSIPLYKIYSLYQEIEKLLDEDIGKHIKKHKNNEFHRTNDEGILYNPIIQTQIIKITKTLHSFVDSLTSEEKNIILKNRYWKGISHIIQQASNYLYNTHHEDDINYLTYIEITKEIDCFFQNINQIFEVKKDGENSLHYHVEQFKNNIMKYIGSIHIKPTSDEEYQTICDLIFDKIVFPFFELVDDPEQLKKFNKDIDIFEQNIIILLKTKKYQHNNLSTIGGAKNKTNTSDTHGLFNQIYIYHESNEDVNVTESINKLEKYEDQKINILTQNELQILLDIVVEKGMYEFAARIRDIIATKN